MFEEMRLAPKDLLQCLPDAVMKFSSFDVRSSRSRCTAETTLLIAVRSNSLGAEPAIGVPVHLEVFV